MTTALFFNAKIAPASPPNVAPGAWTQNVRATQASPFQNAPIDRHGKLSYADAVDKTIHSVVNISAKKRGDRNGGAHHHGPQDRQGSSLGSGVIVRKDGMILTNNHVISGAKEIVVRMHDGRSFPAKIVGTDPKSDLAVLKIKAKKLRVVEFGSSKELRVGDVVLAIGNPFGVGQTVTAGIVSALGRHNVNITDYENFIQTDAAINPGNSGGALITSDGNLVGINTAILSRTGGSHGIGFAIPVSMALPIMERILDKGFVARGWLGVSIHDLDAKSQRALKMKTNQGVVVADVERGSPAQEAGLRAGDVIVGLDGKEMMSVQRLRHTVAMIPPGTQVLLRVIREGQRKSLRATIGSLETRSTVAKGSEPTGSGIMSTVVVKKLNDRTKRRLRLIPDLEGVIVEQLDRDSVASQSGLKRGDVILEINRKEVTSAKAFQKLTAANDGPLALLILRDGQAFYLLISKD